MSHPAKPPAEVDVPVIFGCRHFRIDDQALIRQSPILETTAISFKSRTNVLQGRKTISYQPTNMESKKVACDFLSCYDTIPPRKTDI